MADGFYLYAEHHTRHLRDPDAEGNVALCGRGRDSPLHTDAEMVASALRWSDRLEASVIVERKRALPVCRQCQSQL